MRTRLRAIGHILATPIRTILWPIRSLARWLARARKKIGLFFAEEPEDAPLPDTVANVVENPGGVLEHINALRKHLFRALAGLAIATTIVFVFLRPLLEFLAQPLPGGLEALKAIDVTENVGTSMRVALLGGFALAFPYIAFEIWLFMAPGLKPRSRLYGLLAIPVITIFFLMGMAFAFYLILPVGLPVLINFLGLKTDPRPASFFSFVIAILFWIGIAFEFPILVSVLAKIGVVRAEMLSRNWRIAVVAIAIIAAMATPTVDPVNMFLVMGPMIALYGLSILLAKIAQGKREERHSAA